MRNLSVLLLLTACGSAAPPPSTAADSPPIEEGQEVVLERRARPGDRFVLTTEARDRTRSVVRMPGEPVEESVEDATHRLRADAVVLDVDAQGRVARIELTVKHATRLEGGEEEAVVPAGAVIQVSRALRPDEEPGVTWVGGTLTEEQAAWITDVVDSREADVGADEMYGTVQPRAVGESWPIDAARAARNLDSMPTVRVSEERLRGQSTLAALTEIEGVPCMEIVTELELGDLSVLGLPPRVQLREAVATGRARRWLPLAIDRPTLREESAFEMRFTAAVPTPEGRGTLEVTAHNTSRSDYRF